MKIQRLKKLLSYYRPYKKELFLDVLSSIIHSISVTIIPILINYLISNVVYFEKSRSYKLLMVIAPIIAGMFVLIFFCERYNKYQGNMLSVKVEKDIKVDLFEHLLKQDFSFFDERKVGELLTYIATDTYNLTTLIKKVPEILFDFLIRLIGAGIVLFTAHIIFGIATFSVLFIILGIAMYYIPKMQKEVLKSIEIYSKLTSDLEESIAGMKTVQSLASEEKQRLEFRKNVEIYVRTKDKINKFEGTLQAIIYPISVGLIPIVTVIAMFFVANGDIKLNDLILFMLYADILIAPLFGIFSLISEFNEGVVGIKRVFDILEVKPQIVDMPNAVKISRINGNIKFKNVSFKYDSSDNWIIKNLNFEIKAREYVAIVGLSGVGKTTLCHLIPRFYDCLEGEILIDDIPIKNIKLKSLRGNIGIVRQNIFLFSGKVIDNIRYGNPNASYEEVVEASKKAYAHEFIEKLEYGYDTILGERGQNLSGGQKQRIAIARAFLRDPSILIFDEATSSLDSESERFVKKSMENLAKNRTTIVIAHRFSTIQNAKRILVLNDNGILEEGTHEELLKKDGIYKELHKLQFNEE